MRIRNYLYATVGLILLCPAPSVFAYNNPPLEWKTIRTEHFEVHFPEGAEWTARRVAEVAEEVHGPLTDLYDYEPDTPVHFVIRDNSDYANGAAFFYENKVEIWATNLEFGFRGTTEWVRNVVTHEYAHIISIQASTRMPKRFPAVYLQLIGFEDEKRSDVLNGYPNNIISYPFSGVLMPPWFAEGIAQYQSPARQYDCWDAHRDMILRCAVLEDKMLSYDEMSFFGKGGLQSEQVYDHGYGLVNFIVSQYGPGAIADITREMKSPRRFNIDGALKKVTGSPGEELYENWKSYLKKRYDEQIRDLVPREGREIAGGGFMTTAPVFNRDGSRIAFLSNEGSEFAGTALYLVDRSGKNKKVLRGGVSSRPQFSPDDGKIVYSRKVKVDRYGSTVNDLFVHDLASHKETRVTRGLRGADPSYSPDGKELVCVVNSDGTHRLVRLDADGGGRRELYWAGEGAQLYNPQYSPDGDRILFGVFSSGTRDIASISSDGGDFRYELRSPSDERDASWARSGASIVFASDRSGIFNIYELDLESGRVKQLTDVVGGAFLPDLATARGEGLVYSRYDGDGYGVFYLDRISDPVASLDRALYQERTAGPFDECRKMRAAASLPGGNAATQLARSTPAEPLTARTDTGASIGLGQALPDSAATKYKPAFTPFQFYPRFVLWDGTPRFGLFMNSLEILDKQSFFLGGSYGTDNEYDVFLNYEIRNFYPTFFADFFAVRERDESNGIIDEDPVSATFRSKFNFDLRYDVWEADLGLKLEFGPALSLTRQNELALFWTHAEYSVNVIANQFDQSATQVARDEGGWKYYIADQAHLRYTYRKLTRSVDTDINPRGGRAITVSLMRAFDELFENGQFIYGFRPSFTKNHFNQYTLDWREYVRLPYLRHSLRLRLYGSLIDENVSDFFWFYVGGRDGIRGYTYYTIGGRRGALASVTYRFPIKRNINKQFLHLYFRDLYGGVFFEAANAWTESGFKTNDYKRSVGYELRLSLGSFYVFPTAISLVSAYSLDPVSFVDPGFSIPVVITQDRGFSYYFTLGFGFDL
ncbi:MAG: hypothetical protein ACE5EO_02710 [Candidatus Krumholzibacteriia bacterium]